MASGVTQASGVTAVPGGASGGPTTNPVSVAQGGTGVSTAGVDTVFAGPSSGGSAGPPSFRILVSADIASALPGAYGVQSANTVLAGPASGAAANPSFRAPVSLDISGLTYSAANGLVGSPSHTFVSEPTSGLYWNAAADYRFALGGSDILRFTNASQLLVTLNQVGALSWGSAGAGAADLFLYRDTAGIVGQRNSTNAQTSRIYNTYTNSTNGEWLVYGWSSNFVSILTQQNGSGIPRNMNIGTSGNAQLGLETVGTIRWVVNPAGNFVAQSDTTNDIGSASGRVRNGYFNSALSLGSQVITGAVTLTSASPYRTIGDSATPFTQAVPASPLADETRVFTNVGAGTMTVSYTGRTGASTRALAQDAAVTMAFNSTLAYWTTE